MKRLIPIVLIAVFVLGCSSGKNLLEKGDYEDAVLTAIKRLKSNPSNDKAKETLRDGYPLAQQYYLDQVEKSSMSSEPFKWERVIGHYQKLNTIYYEILGTPAAQKVISNPVYYKEIISAKESAADERFNEGMRLMDPNDRVKSKEAYYHFEKAQIILPNHRNVTEKLEQAQYYATTKVLVDQIPVPSQKYRLSGNFFQDQVDSYFVQYDRNPFVRFYTPQEIEGKDIPIDHIVRMEFQDFVVGETHTNERVEDVARQDTVITKETSLKDGTEREVKALKTYKAKLTTVRREVISQGLLNVQIFENSSANVLLNDNVSGAFTWFEEWGSFNGEEEALTDEQIKLCNLRPVMPPQHQDLFVEFTKPIFNDLTIGIHNFYKNY